MPHFAIEPEPVTEPAPVAENGAPRRESIVLVDGERRIVLVPGLAVGTTQVGDRRVDHGYGFDAWDLGDAWLARVASGHSDPASGEGARVVRFLVSRDAGETWTDLDAADARDVEHLAREENRRARIDRWPGGWC